MLKVTAFCLVYLALTIIHQTASKSCEKLAPTGTCSKQQTIVNEGECLCCYYDTSDPPIPTIGIGYNLQNSKTDELLRNYGLTLANVLQDCKAGTVKNCLTKAAAEDIFNTKSYPIAEKCADEFAPGLPAAKRAAVIDMAFMGCDKLKKFVNMQKALKAQQWAKAEAECRDSLWCKKGVGPIRCGSTCSCIGASAGCIGGTCKGSHPTCASRNDCVCTQTSNGDNGFCTPNIRCTDLPDCTNCASPASVCLVGTCCPHSLCISASNECKPRSTASLELILNATKRACNRHDDCVSGTSCEHHISGMYCV